MVWHLAAEGSGNGGCMASVETVKITENQTCGSSTQLTGRQWSPGMVGK
jgi:hypothetical protein